MLDRNPGSDLSQTWLGDSLRCAFQDAKQ